MKITIKTTIKTIMVISLSFFALKSVLLYASTEKPVLKVEDAVKAGYVYSSQVALNSKELELLRERLKDQEKGSYVAYQTIYLQKEKNEQQSEILRDKIAYDIRKRYRNILLEQKEIAKLSHNILVKTNEIYTAKIKKEQGLIEEVQYESMQIELQNLIDSKKSKEETLNNDSAYFKLITNKDVNYYILEDSLSYEIFRIPGAIDRYMDNKIDEYLKGDNDLAEFTKDNLLTETNQTIYYSDYLNRKYNADKSIASIEDAKKEMKDALMNSYSGLLSIEEQISTLNAKHELTLKQIKIAKVKCETGLMTDLEYEKQLLNLEEIEFQQRKLVNEYVSVSEIIQKPWVISKDTAENTNESCSNY